MLTDMPFERIKCPPIRPAQPNNRNAVLTPIVKDVKNIRTKAIGLGGLHRGGPIRSAAPTHGAAGYQQQRAVSDEQGTTESVPEEDTGPAVAVGGTHWTFKGPCCADPTDHQPSAEDKHQRYEAEAANWQQFQADAADRHLITLTKRTQLAQDYRDAIQRQLTAAISNGACDKCGLHTSECRLCRHVAVFVVDTASCHTLQVPIFACTR